jgi:hypothetical protein
VHVLVTWPRWLIATPKLLIAAQEQVHNPVVPIKRIVMELKDVCTVMKPAVLSTKRFAPEHLAVICHLNFAALCISSFVMFR